MTPRIKDKKQKRQQGPVFVNDTLEKLIEDFMRAHGCGRTTALYALGLRHLLRFDPS